MKKILIMNGFISAECTVRCTWEVSSIHFRIFRLLLRRMWPYNFHSFSIQVLIYYIIPTTVSLHSISIVYELLNFFLMLLIDNHNGWRYFISSWIVISPWIYEFELWNFWFFNYIIYTHKWLTAVFFFCRNITIIHIQYLQKQCFTLGLAIVSCSLSKTSSLSITSYAKEFYFFFIAVDSFQLMIRTWSNIQDSIVHKLIHKTFTSCYSIVALFSILYFSCLFRVVKFQYNMFR